MHKLRKIFKKAKNYFTFIVGVYFLSMCVHVCVCMPVNMAFMYVPVCIYMCMFICRVYKYARACVPKYVCVSACVCARVYGERCIPYKIHAAIILLSSKFMPAIPLPLKVLYSAE